MLKDHFDDVPLSGPSLPPSEHCEGAGPFKAPSNGQRRLPRPPFECIALVLQGGRALGAYQAGVYEALAEAAIHPDWVAGISIDAVNAAIIAGNEQGARVDKLREFWTQITAEGPGL